jgi:hypothetical protein
MRADFIIFNGCSFTEGGGLSNPQILNLYGYNLPLDNENHKIKAELSFPNLVANHFNCDYINLSESGNSNENIFQKVFEYVESNLEKLQSYKNVHCFIQTTMPSRKTINYKGNILNLNSFSKNDYPYTKGEYYDDLQKWYELYILNSFDENFEAKRTKKEIYTIREYLKSKNIKPNFMIYSDIYLVKILDKYEYITFEKHNQMMDYIHKNRLRICDEVNHPDGHFSPNGHKRIADILIKKIEND